MGDARLRCDATDDGALLAVRVLPRGSRDEVVGIRAGRLCVRTTAAPVDGAANARVIAFLAKALGYRKSSLRIARGECSREKTLHIRGASPEDVVAAARGALER